MQPTNASYWPRTFLLALALVSSYDFAQASPDSTKESSSMQSNSVHITWHFPATSEKVWTAWTQPELVKQWFGSNPAGTVSNATLDVRPGGRFAVTFVDTDGTEHTASGVYQQIELHRRLEFSWMWKSEPGVETQVTVALFPEPNGTRMEFEHGGHTHVSSHNYESGWRSTFEKMEKAILAP